MRQGRAVPLSVIMHPTTNLLDKAMQIVNRAEGDRSSLKVDLRIAKAGKGQGSHWVWGLYENGEDNIARFINGGVSTTAEAASAEGAIALQLELRDRGL